MFKLNNPKIRSRLNSILIAIGLVLIYFTILSIVPSILPSSWEIGVKNVEDIPRILTDVIEGATRPMIADKETIHSNTYEVLESPQPTNVDHSPTPVDPELEDNNNEDIDMQSELSSSRTPKIPERIIIPSIGLNAPIVLAPLEELKLVGRTLIRWQVPEKFAVGWHQDSARIGEPGNTVLSGHHNAFGEVLVNLKDINVGEEIRITSGDYEYKYIITNKLILPEKYEDLDTRLENARWIQRSSDERITIITCWPYETNTHRLIVVAKPVY